MRRYACLASKQWPRYGNLQFRAFSQHRCLKAIRPLLLSDIGEGIKECEIIQWFVANGAQVQEFDKLCEVQSDKASVEITSRYTGTIKKLHYEAGDMAQVGRPLLDIDTQEEDKQGVEAVHEPESHTSNETRVDGPERSKHPEPSEQSSSTPPPQNATMRTFATPAVRRIIRENNLNIADIKGTGKDGRVTKDDVQQHLDTPTKSTPPPIQQSNPRSSLAADRKVPLSPIQNQMFKQMTKSLSIPHFLYADEIHMDSLSTIRTSTNTLLAASETPRKLSFMPFFIKALSLALDNHPLLNARLSFDEEKPSLVYRAHHNVGVAMDTPSGLLVPNIKDVANKSILEIGEELKRIQALGAEGKLSSADLRDGTITISNIGSVGGTYLAPVVVTSEVAIVGIGKMRQVPSFDKDGKVVANTIVNGSWSADHRVVDGMSLARLADEWKRLVEKPELMLARMK